MTTLTIIILLAALIIYDRLVEMQDVIQSNHDEGTDYSDIEDESMRSDADWLRTKYGYDD